MYVQCDIITPPPPLSPQLVPLQGRFSQLPQVLQPHGQAENSIDAVLFDVGASSMQFDEISRGFSLSRDGPLDMRMDGNRFRSESGLH